MAAVSSKNRRCARLKKLATVPSSKHDPDTARRGRKSTEKQRFEARSRVEARAAGSGSRSSHDKRREVQSSENVRQVRGDRRKGKPRNNSLPLNQARALQVGASNAVRVGLPLNRFMTVNWEQAGVPDPVGATGVLLKLIKDALRKKGQSTAYLWVQECGPHVGQHVHILLHVPPPLRRWFNGLQRGWLKRCGARPGKGIVKSAPIGASYSAAFGDEASRANYGHALGRVLDYLLKDAEPKARAVLGIQHRGSFGTVAGKRSAVSQNLRGATSRAASSISRT